MEPFRAADHVAQELRTPGLQQQAIQEIRQDLLNMTPGEALAFTRRLNEDTRGQSPLHERQEMRIDPYSHRPMPTGGELLFLNDPYQGGEVAVKQIRREFCHPVEQVVPRVGYGTPGYGAPGYGPGYGRPGYIAPVPSVGVGVGIPLGRNARIGLGVNIPLVPQY